MDFTEAALKGTSFISAKITEMIESGDQARWQRYEGILRPLYDQFLAVHVAYRKAFLEIKNYHDPDPLQLEGNAIRFERKAVIASIERIREESHTLRQDVRFKCQPLLYLLKDKPERIFVIAIAMYFIDDYSVATADNPRQLDFYWIDSILDKGPDALPTPTKQMVEELRNSQLTAEELSKLAAKSLDRLDKRYFLVSSAYVELQFAVLPIAKHKSASRKEA